MQSSSSSLQHDANAEARWYAVRVRSRHEKAVASSMESKGLETFLPLYSAARKSPGSRKPSLLPLIPGYLFCRFDSVAHGSVLRTPGVVGVIGLDDRPELFPDSEIGAIRTPLGAPASGRVASTAGAEVKLWKLGRSMAVEIGKARPGDEEPDLRAVLAALAGNQPHTVPNRG